MKNIIDFDVNKQPLNTNFSINISTIKKVSIVKYKSDVCIGLNYINGDFDEYYNNYYENNDYIHIYFKILKYIQDFNNNKIGNDFLVFTDNGVNLLSELNIKNI